MIQHHYYGNAKLNYFEILSHCTQNGCRQKSINSKQLRLWKKRYPYSLIIGVQTGTSTMETNVYVPQTEIPCDSKIPFLSIYNRLLLLRHWLIDVYSCSRLHSQELTNPISLDAFQLTNR
jgi:hypothetical protein